jgi:hypothetical protein
MHPVDEPLSTPRAKRHTEGGPRDEAPAEEQQAQPARKECE